MRDLNDDVFIILFKQACEKCFGFALTAPLTETDSKLLSNKIQEQTGLVIGVKSIKNYSYYVLKVPESKPENPSVATLDTLARYVLNAPYTDEVKRKDNESHHPYWFQFRTQHSAGTTKKINLPVRKIIFVLAFIAIAATGLSIYYSLGKPNLNQTFNEIFDSVNQDSLKNKGWIILNTDSASWKQRDQLPGHLTLFTLTGDNWPGEKSSGGIKNLLVKEIDVDCFTTEVHFTEFFPTHNWQQAGILLSENSDFNGKMVRLSISYNDFFGGYSKVPEIIIQGISSTESGSVSKPEEFTHSILFNIGTGEENLIKKNLTTSALKIEKIGAHFRFLYNSGQTESFAFKEVVTRDFNFKPKYVALFAIQGLTNNTNVIPVNFDSFQLVELPCAN